jgi:soluble lytic murein transglycosylase
MLPKMLLGIFCSFFWLANSGILAAVTHEQLKEKYKFFDSKAPLAVSVEPSKKPPEELLGLKSEGLDAPHNIELLKAHLGGGGYHEAVKLRLINSYLEQKKTHEAMRLLPDLASSVLLGNTQMLGQLLAKMSKAQSGELVKILTKNGYFNEIKSLCPFFELPTRSARARFLFNLSKAHSLLAKERGQVYRQLFITHPEVVSEEEIRGLPLFSQFAKALTAADYIKRVENLLLFGQNTAAQKTIDQAQKALPKMSDSYRCEFRYQQAKILRKQKKFRESRGQLAGIIQECDGETRHKARFLDIMIAAILQDEKSLPTFDALVADFPTHGFSDDTLIFKSNLLFDVGRNEEALNALDQVITQFPKGDMIERALFMKAWHLAKEKKVSEALEPLKKLMSITSPTSLAHSQAKYWLHRMALFGGPMDFIPPKSADAANLAGLEELLMLKNPNVYSWLSLELLKYFKKSYPKPQVKMAQPMPTIIPQHPTLQMIDQLIEVGFRREALWLLEEIEWSTISDEEKPLVAIFYDRLNRPELAHHKVVACSQRVATIVEDRVPELFLSIAFARPYEQEVAEATARTNLAPEIVFAVMQNESKFLAGALSWAQARGLMQIMYPSAVETAKSLGITLTSEEDLFDPGINLNIGSKIFANYQKQFGLVAGIAAYNAGPGNVKKWLQQKATWPVDAFFEDIHFTETRQYTGRILGSLLGYWRLSPSSSLPEISLKTTKN